MKKIWTLTIVLVVAAAFLVTPCLAKTTWNANSVWPPKNNHSVGLTEFAEKVKTATKGELELAVSSGGALGYKGPELLKVVRDGLVPVSDMLISGVAGDEKIFQIVTLPFLVRDFKELKMLIDMSRPAFDKAAAKWNQKILYIAPWPGAGLWTKKKITTVADMKGLKTRTYDKNGALVMEAVGATPLALPFSEVYTSLQTGVIDSVMTSTPTAVDAKFWEVLKYYEPLNITIATDMTNVNLKAFQKLPKAQQDALVKAGKEMETDHVGPRGQVGQGHGVHQQQERHRDRRPVQADDPGPREGNTEHPCRVAEDGAAGWQEDLCGLPEESRPLRSEA